MCFKIPVSSQDSGLGGSNDIILCTLNASDQSSSGEFLLLLSFCPYSSVVTAKQSRWSVTSLYETEFPDLVLD